MQNVRSAKSSKTGRVARRAMDMLLKQTAISPAYSTIVAAGRQAKKKKKKNGSNSNSSKSVSMCTGKFMLASIDTFGQTAMGACVPDGTVSASVRSFVKKQIVVTVGTNNIGFCHFFHCLGNDGISTISTNAGFTGTNAQWCVGGGTINLVISPGLDVGNLATPFSQAQLTTGQSAGTDDRAAYNARIVGAGFSFRYSGKEIDRAGQCYVYTHPTHNSALSTFSGATEVISNPAVLAQYSETMIVESSREDTHIPCFPVADGELEYSGETSINSTQLLYPYSQGASLQPGGFAVNDSVGNRIGIATTTFMVVGTPGTTYTINYGQHMEVIGLGVQAFSRMPSDSDPVGVKDVFAASTRFQLNRVREPGADPVKEFKSALSAIQRDRAVRYNL